jgi:hypothetical protein
MTDFACLSYIHPSDAHLKTKMPLITLLLAALYLLMIYGLLMLAKQTGKWMFPPRNIGEENSLEGNKSSPSQLISS